MEWIDIIEKQPNDGEEVLIQDIWGNLIVAVRYGDYFHPDSVSVWGYDGGVENVMLMSVVYWSRIDAPNLGTMDLEAAIKGRVRKFLNQGPTYLLRRGMVCEFWDVHQGEAQRILNSLMEEGSIYRRQVDGIYTYFSTLYKKDEGS